MKKTPIKKLALASESIRNLFADRLRVVQGGIPDTTNFATACPSLHTHCNCVPA